MRDSFPHVGSEDGSDLRKPSSAGVSMTSASPASPFSSRPQDLGCTRLLMWARRVLTVLSACLALCLAAQAQTSAANGQTKAADPKGAPEEGGKKDPCAVNDRYDQDKTSTVNLLGDSDWISYHMDRNLFAGFEQRPQGISSDEPEIALPDKFGVSILPEPNCLPVDQ